MGWRRMGVIKTISIQTVRWVLLACGWLLAMVAMPLNAGSLNHFMRYRGELETWYFLQWLVSLPRQVARDVGIAGTVYLQDIVWMVFVLAGLGLFVFAPVLLLRVKKSTGQMAVRCVAPVMLLLPATLLMPEAWRFPTADVGLWVLGAGHVLVFGALVLGDDRGERRGGFPLEMREV